MEECYNCDETNKICSYEEGTFDEINGCIQCQNCYKNFVKDIKKCENDHGICLKCYEEIKDDHFGYRRDMECTDCDYIFEKYTIKKEYYHKNKDYDSDCDSNGEYKSYWGNISTQFYEDINGKYQNTYKRFNEEELLIYEAHYKDGLKNGSFKEWYENGKQLKEECFYKDDEFDGHRREWYENGQLKKVSFYINGEKEGLFIEYQMDGTKIFENTWKDGDITHYVDEFYENGNKKFESVWLDINRKLISYHEDGKIIEVTYFKGEDIINMEYYD